MNYSLWRLHLRGVVPECSKLVFEVYNPVPVEINFHSALSISSNVMHAAKPAD